MRSAARHAPTLLGALDRARESLLALLAPWIGAALRAREPRVALLGSIAALTGLALACAVPRWALALGPLVVGVPHLVADLRYLVFRPGLHRARALTVATLLGLALAAAGLGLRGALVPVAAAVALARASLPRRAALLALTAAAFALAQRYTWRADVAFAHLHNLIALALWLAWRPRATRWHLAPLGLTAAGVALLASGALDPALTAAFGRGPQGASLSLRALAWDLCPGLSAPHSLRLLALYAFGQSVHYGVWLRLIPDEDRPRSGTRSFRASWDALLHDVPRWIVVGALALFVALGLYAAIDLGVARQRYLQLAFFHGYLELIVLARLAAGERGR